VVKQRQVLQSVGITDSVICKEQIHSANVFSQCGHSHYTSEPVQLTSRLAASLSTAVEMRRLTDLQYHLVDVLTKKMTQLQLQYDASSMWLLAIMTSRGVQGNLRRRKMRHGNPRGQK